MSWVESAAASYADAVASLLPLQRAAIAALAIVYLALARISVEGSALYNFLDLGVVGLSEVSGPIATSFVIGDIVFGLIIAVAAALLTRFVIFCFFSVALRSTYLLERLRSSKFSGDGLDFDQRSSVVTRLEMILERRARRIRSLNRASEFLVGSGLILLIGGWGSLPDVLVAVFLVAASLLASFKSVEFFLSDYFAISSYISRLDGISVEGPADL